MWHLIKAEIKSNYIIWSILSGTFFILMFAFIFLGLSETEESLPAVQVVMITLAAIVFLIRILRISREKIDRVHSQLPVNINQIALSRVLLPVLFWILMVLVLTLVLLLLKADILTWEYLRQFATLSGFIFAANSVPLIQRDVSFILKDKWQRFLLQIFYTFIVMLGYLFFIFFIMDTSKYTFFKLLTPLQIIVKPVAYSAIGSLTFFCIGVLMVFLSVSVFRLRKSYVE